MNNWSMKLDQRIDKFKGNIFMKYVEPLESLVPRTGPFLIYQHGIIIQ